MARGERSVPRLDLLHSFAEACCSDPDFGDLGFGREQEPQSVGVRIAEV
jgi:hypothetical protein